MSIGFKCLDLCFNVAAFLPVMSTAILMWDSGLVKQDPSPPPQEGAHFFPQSLNPTKTQTAICVLCTPYSAHIPLQCALWGVIYFIQNPDH